MNSVQDFNTSRYGQPSQPANLAANLPSQSMETGMNLPASAVPPAFASPNAQPRRTAPSMAEQQALLNQLSQAGYRIDDSRLREIDRLSEEQKLEKTNMAGMGYGVAAMFLGEPIQELGDLHMRQAGQFVKDKWISDKLLDKIDDWGEATSLRRAGLQRNITTNALELLDPAERTGLKGFWNRAKPGIKAINHTEYMEAGKQLRLQDLQKLHPDLPESVIKQMPGSAVTGAGKVWKQAKYGVRSVTESVRNLGKDIARGVGIKIPPTPATSINTNLPVEVPRHSLKTANFVKPAETPKAAGFFEGFKALPGETKALWQNGEKFKAIRGVGGKALGVAGIALTAYSVGSNAIDNYKNQNYRAIATDVVGQAAGIVASSYLTAGCMAAATLVCAPLGPFAPVAGMLIGGVVAGVAGQAVTNFTKWAVDPLFKMFGLKNKDDDTKSKIKENRELLTNIAAGTGSAVGSALRAMPRQGMPNPSMFGSAGSSVVKGALNF
jgi:hypothetical protein